MSKIISALHRNAAGAARAEQKLARILEAITPDILTDLARPLVRRDGNHVQGCLNFPDHFPRRGLSLCQGKLYDDARTTTGTTPWWVPGSGVPDGSYAILREDSGCFEAVTDPVGGRSLWYYFDDEVFVVSNSQRAITLYIGRFEFEPAVVPWLMATGALGLGMSYSRHLRALPPASSLLLDKAAWTLALTEGEIRFAADPRPPEAHRRALRAALDDTLASFGPEDARHAIVSLSGGADSRAIAALLMRARPGPRWRSLTGGPVEASRMPNTDVFIAEQVAARLGTDHRFIATRDSPEPIETIIDRFVLASEGRVDHLEGYLDGLAHFRAFAAEGIEVIIRGDTCFGGPRWEPADSALAMRRTISLLLCREIADLQSRVRGLRPRGPGHSGAACPARRREPARLARPPLPAIPGDHRARRADRDQGGLRRRGQPAAVASVAGSGLRPARRDAL